MKKELLLKLPQEPAQPTPTTNADAGGFPPLRLSWIVLLAGLLVLFRDVVLWVVRAPFVLVARLGGSPRPVSRRTLKRYGTALIARYQQVYVPFRPNRPLDMRDMYVPLKIAGSSHNQEHLESVQAIAAHQRSVIVGVPGAGKTMLLQHIALRYADQLVTGDGNTDDTVVPVLLSLHRLNTPGLSLFDHLVEVLTQHQVPNAARFALNALEQGRLLLLFDGLDEVSRTHRERVVSEVANLARTYDTCRLVITCRDSVYTSDLLPVSLQKLEVVALDDQQIRRFLRSWERDMQDNGVSVEQLMQTLRDQPQILALARNPLLLTIIAYLSTDMSFVLPHSRAEFYRKATDVLLDQWHQERNRFEARHKRLVLQNLALFMLEHTHQQQGGDTSTGSTGSTGIDRQRVLARLETMMPGMNLPSQLAPLLLDEIVERSGLLFPVDGDGTLCFAHQTLQEFFAAAELLDTPDGLIQRFRAAPETWREVVKLWCGLARNSTSVIRAVFSRDPVTALECLADTQQVDNLVAHSIIKAFKALLGKNRKTDAIARALGTVASDDSPRGQAVFAFLEETLVTADTAARRMAAASALSYTNLPEAAVVLTANYAICPDEVRAPLVRMGDLAVPALASLSATGLLETLDDLQAIGTSHAAEALVPLLWNDDMLVAGRAAWCLATLLGQPTVANLLRTYPLTDVQCNADTIDWVWQPFDEPAESSMPHIAGRIAFLIEHAPPETIPAKQLPIDPRLAIPLCSVQSSEEVRNLENLPQSDHEWVVWSLHTLRNQVSAGTGASDALSAFVEKTCALMQASPRWRYLVSSLPPTIQFNLLLRLVQGPRPTPDDWRNIYRPVRYHYKTSWHYRAILALVALASVGALGQIAATLAFAPVLLGWHTMGMLGAGVVVLWGWFVLWRDGITRKPELLLSGLLGLVAVPYTLYTAAVVYREHLTLGHYIAYIPLAFWSLTIAVLLSAALGWVLAPLFVVLVWLVLVGAGLALWLVGSRRDRAARNPLRGL